MAETASNIAKYILCHFRTKGEPIDNLKLQKLLYYTQAWHLVNDDCPLFADRIEAWVHGPVVPTVFQIYKAYRWSPIMAEVSYSPDQEVAEHIDDVIEGYGHFSAGDLERLTHSEDPWKEARGNLAPDVACNRVITDESMKRFYSSHR